MKTVAFLCFSFLYFRYTLCSCPSNDLEITSVEDVYEFLWENNSVIAFETLRVDFLQQMQSGSLQAERYISFTMQDINYILTVTKMLKEMSEKEIQPDDLRDFIKGRYLSYKKYTDLMLERFSFKDAPAIQQTPAMTKYLSFYRELMEDPLDFAVGLLPCARLWVWLGKNLKTPQNNAYYNWKVENMDGHPEKHYKALLDKHLDTYEKVEKANNIFREQMRNEHDFFYSS
ncbi:uncharacterized protein LOC130069612 [Rhinichthys klamathensis goyatoka]|uniref:uncharacterized protein LOC130069612 n=1 Tax=Rhinichthys klamathensis goyatoka TaxID=3034132 RepID=UPI0024B5A45F|nr:uncharacterized protein LOC130069612 [Rhinichthys klamathensis goyatoka]